MLGRYNWQCIYFLAFWYWQFPLLPSIAIIVFVLHVFSKYCLVSMYFILEVSIFSKYSYQFLPYVLAYYNIDNYYNKIAVLMVSNACNPKSLQPTPIHCTGSFNTNRNCNFVEITIWPSFNWSIDQNGILLAIQVLHFLF
jgi:hypothetical protein